MHNRDENKWKKINLQNTQAPQKVIYLVIVTIGPGSYKDYKKLSILLLLLSVLVLVRTMQSIKK